MGLLQQGQWVDQWYDTGKSEGKFEREAARFRHWVTADGNAGPTGDSGFKAEAGRYHLYVSLACPWAHRTLIFRTLKNLESLIAVTVVEPHMLENGWEFAGSKQSHNARHIHGAEADPLYGKDYLYQLYLQAAADYSGRVTVPVLWDKQQNTIVSNESADIIRMFNSAFNRLTGNSQDYYPKPLRSEIDALNERIYHNINNGVYRAGFATSQQAYEQAFDDVFNTLDWLEQRLCEQRYLTGSQLTEADWRLFTTLIRFDAVYHGHFKTNRQRLADYPQLSAYLRDLYQQPGVAATVNFEHIKQHYYYSHGEINPTRIVPKGPLQDFSLPHQRHRLDN
ncbi:MAG: glutathionyl-hydroquinone reductase [Shewanella sp.]|jgi:putative glutathione S-transferase|uniref:glutathione S-transferase family protein n=1 Tax=unclassified Shewanella TaxID=196818 RepID=UPI001A99607A|nr:glutathione S-transferase family protein [Shewanella sp. 4t3-1-2LB]MBO1272604.1 glutathione S-transferase family protein [Shewanella sp. 4t3-1-2LB]MDN5369141.1 glutathionyl-hydroquinone reductase [Shewanella sp.]